MITRPAVADDALRRALDGVADLAPLHVPPALALLDLLRDVLPDVPHVLCPDTAFHAGLPPHAATDPLPAATGGDWRRR